MCDSVPVINIRILFLLFTQYPTVCWFQSRTYRVQIVDNATELVVEERGPLTANREDLVVTETFSGLDRHKNYIARVYADSFAGSVNTTVDFSAYISQCHAHCIDNNSKC